MTTFKANVRKKQLRLDGEANIKIRIIHNRKTVYISTNWYITPKDFDNSTGTVLSRHPNDNILNNAIRLKIIEMEKILLRKYEDRIDYVDVYTLKESLRKQINTTGVLKYIDNLIQDMRKNGKDGNADVYSLSRNYLEKYIGSDVSFNEITYQFLTKYYNFMVRDGLSANTISMYLRVIRSIFNKAIDEEIVPLDLYPFRKFKIPKYEPAKRNLSPLHILRIANCELSGAEEKARDVFMLSFYLIGMNLADLYKIEKSQLFADRIDYKRQKTGARLSIKVYPEAMILIQKYKSKGKYLFTFHNDYSNRKNFNKQINKYLKFVARRLGITRPVSVYYARHSWATIAVSLGFSRDAIGAALGHSSNTVTDGYIDYDPAVIDNINEAVINKVKNS